VIENWAPLAEIPVLPKANEWALQHDLADKRVLLYAGTLGVKHDWRLLYKLAVHFRTAPDVRVVVVSEGPVADKLRAHAAAAGLENLISLDFQPYARLPEVFATADVLVALLERDAGVFSVPSKVLTYLCAGRAVLAAIPSENLAARVVSRGGCGIVVDPGSVAAFVNAAAILLDDDAARTALGSAARRYAEKAFDPDEIADAFEEVVAQVVGAYASNGGDLWHSSSSGRREFGGNGAIG
jgi:glycosyltransferase involved in cell wall biosynthesis